MSQEKDFRPVYQRLLSQCQPYSHDGPWQELPVLGGMCRPPADSMTVVRDLQQQFSQAELLEAGILAMDKAREAHLDPVLCDQHATIIPLRRASKDSPFDLLTDRGTLSGRRLPICASLRDARIRKLIRAEKEKLMLVASTAADAAVLLSLKIPATLAWGLAQLGGRYLKPFQRCFDLYPPKPPPRFETIHDDEEEKKKEKRPPDLVFVGCSLARMSLEEPVNLSATVSHLAGVEEHLDLPLDGFYRWQPTQRDPNHRVPDETRRPQGSSSSHPGES